METGVKGLQRFRVTDSVRCAPAVYEPSVVAIVNGTKEAILDGTSYVYDSSQYMCCNISMPVAADTPEASPENPLLGVIISLDTRVMTELAIEMESAAGAIRSPRSGPTPKGIELVHWDDAFTIEFSSTHLDKTVTIDDLATQVGMSRAVFHRNFKQATTMSPIQFVKSMKLNSAVMQIAGGMNISDAPMGVGYVSSSQFSREFKRLYGHSPKQWSHSRQAIAGV